MSEPSRTGGGKVDNRRILTAVAIALAVVHLAQMVSGGNPWFGVVGFGIAAAFFAGWRLELLRSVRTAVVLLILLSVACILGTLTVQRSQLSHASAEEFQSTVAFAWAHLLVKVTHPIPRSVDLPQVQQAHLEQLATVFGDDIADEERENATKGLIAAADEATARTLAKNHPEIFAGLYRFADMLLLTDVFHAWWFIALFYLLTLNLVFGALVRRPLSVRNAGFHGTHIGLVLVVIGATGGAFLGERGFVPLQVGQGSNVLFDGAGGAESPLGFTVRLDHFETLYHEDLVVETRSAGAASRNPHHGMMGMDTTDPAAPRHTFKLEKGSTIDLTDPDSGESYSLALQDIDEAAGMKRVFHDAADGEDGVLAARLGMPGAPEEGLWITDRDGVFIDPTNGFKIRLEEGTSDDALAALEPACSEQVGSGEFFLRAAPGAPPLTQRVVEGAVAQMGPLTATFIDVIPNFRVGAEEQPGDYPRNPALWVQLRDDEGLTGEYLFFSNPVLKGFTQLPWPGVEASFDYDYWCTSTGTRVRLLVQPGGGAHAVVALDGEPPRPQPAAVGDRIEHPTLPGAIQLLEILPRAVEQMELVRGDGAAEGQLLFTALQLGIDGPDGSSEQWLLSNTSAGSLVLGGQGGGGLTLRLEDNRMRPPRDWRSQLSFLEEGRVMRQGTIEVNQPACYSGYCFFQSDADAKRPDYSGLQVVRDPAWVPVKAGLWLLLLGISWVFYLQPVFDRRQRAAREKARADRAASETDEGGGA